MGCSNTKLIHTQTSHKTENEVFTPQFLMRLMYVQVAQLPLATCPHNILFSNINSLHQYTISPLLLTSPTCVGIPSQKEFYCLSSQLIL